MTRAMKASIVGLALAAVLGTGVHAAKKRDSTSLAVERGAIGQLEIAGMTIPIVGYSFGIGQTDDGTPSNGDTFPGLPIDLTPLRVVKAIDEHTPALLSAVLTGVDTHLPAAAVRIALEAGELRFELTDVFIKEVQQAFPTESITLAAGKIAWGPGGT